MSEKKYTEYQERIQKLESDNARLRSELSNVTGYFHELVQKLPMAAAVSNKYSLIVSANRLFVSMFGADVEGLSQDNEYLYEVDMREVVPEAVNRIIKRGRSGENIVNEIARLKDKNISVSVHSFAKGDMVLVLVRNLYDADAVNEDIAERLRQTIDQKMEMVQKIGFLLGEEVSVVVENLNSIIKIIESPRNEK